MELQKPIEEQNYQSPQDVSSHLRQVIENYLQNSTHLSVNGLSKKCGVSEPTLRRIINGKIKTLPNLSTVLDILSYLSSKESAFDIMQTYPGPIADYLKQAMPHITDVKPVYDPLLNKELKNQTKYLIYKLAATARGVTAGKVEDLFGRMGLHYIEELEEKGFLSLKEGLFRSKSQFFSGKLSDFLGYFQATSDFIKTRENHTTPLLNPLLVNYSCSLTPDQYKRVVKIQKKALAKVREVMMEETEEGEIPAFLLMAFDTLDSKTAWELTEK